MRRIATAGAPQALLDISRELAALQSRDASMALGLTWLRDEVMIALLPTFGRAMVVRFEALQQQVLDAQAASGGVPVSGDLASTDGAGHTLQDPQAADRNRPRGKKMVWLGHDPEFPMDFMVDDQCYAQADLDGGRIRVLGQRGPVALTEDQTPALLAAMRSELRQRRRRAHTAARDVTAIYDEDPRGFDRAIAQVEAELDGRQALADDPAVDQQLRNTLRAESVEEVEFVWEQTRSLLEQRPDLNPQVVESLMRTMRKRVKAYFLLRDAARSSIDERREAAACGVSLDALLELLDIRDVEATVRAFEGFLDVALSSRTPDAEQRLASGAVSHDVYAQGRIKARVDAILAAVDGPLPALPEGVTRTAGVHPRSR